MRHTACKYIYVYQGIKMAEKKKMGIIDRFIMGSEKSEGYARSKLPSSRWSLFWDVFKGRFSKVVITNILILLFCLPLLAVLIVRSMMITGMGQIGPFSQCFGVGYQALYSFSGMSETIVYNTNFSILVFLPICALIAGIGIAGGTYVSRNMIWTEGLFVANDFWRGIKDNAKQVIPICAIYSVLLLIGMLSLSSIDRIVGVGDASVWFIIIKVLIYIALGIFSILTLHAITMAVTYDLKFTALIKNCMLMTVAMPFHNVFFLIVALIPYILCFLGGMLSTMGFFALIIFGVCYTLLVWTDFSHWAYDKFINDKVPGAKKNRGIYKKISENDSESLKQYREQLAKLGPSMLSSRPIKPITDDELKLEELPTTFSRADLERLNASKKAIYDDNEKYVEEHMNDPEYVSYREKYNKLVEETEKEKIEREKRVAKAKKQLEKRNKRK